MPTDPAAELPEGYYLDNFEEILRTVGQRDADLLDEAEHAFLQDFRRLTVDARRLWVRLASRRGPLFRRDRLEYSEIRSLDAAIVELVGADLLDLDPHLPCEAALGLVRRNEALEVAQQLLEPPLPQRKGDLVDRLARECALTDLEQALKSRWTWLALARESVLDTFRLLYFGNLFQDWTELVLRDLEVRRYEPFPLGQNTRLLPDRRAVDDALTVHRARNAQHTAREEGRLEDLVAIGAELLERPRWHPSVEPLLDRVLLRAGRAAERSGDSERALAFYRRCRTPPARERHARLLERLDERAAALQLADRIATQPRDETEAIFGPRFAHRLRRRDDPSLPPLPRPPRPRIRLVLPRSLPPDRSAAASPPPDRVPPDPRPRDPPPVETRVLEHLAAEGREALFSENWLWTSLFGLAFWDVIFAPVPGAFLHPFQLAPLDLDDPTAFFPRRRRLVAERLAELRALTDLAPQLLPLWEAKRHTANRFVAWSDAARVSLEVALRRVRGPALAVVSERLVRDLRRYRRGLPDLLVASTREPGFELWEVKGPGDSLRAEQGAWIDHLRAHGIPARVVEVRWAEDA